MKFLRFSALSFVLALLVLLGTTPTNAQMMTYAYDITITNLTNAQVLTPPLLATHDAMQHVWMVGDLASPELQALAETGNTQPLAEALADAATDVQVGDGMIAPGESMTIRITAHDGDALTALTMLAFTNDGFTGLDAVPLQEGSIEAMAYDAGTEENTESAADVPGLGGEGHVPTEPQAPIAMHPGIQGNADLGTEYAWEGAVARFDITMVGDMAAPETLPETGGDATQPLTLYLLLLGGALLVLGVGTRLLRRTS